MIPSGARELSSTLGNVTQPSSSRLTPIACIFCLSIQSHALFPYSFSFHPLGLCLSDRLGHQLALFSSSFSFADHSIRHSDPGWSHILVDVSIYISVLLAYRVGALRCAFSFSHVSCTVSLHVVFSWCLPETRPICPPRMCR